jgi:transposase-like protein
MPSRYPREEVEKALALAAAGASVATIAESTSASPSTVRRWLREAASADSRERPGHPPGAQPSTCPRAPSVEPTAATDDPAGAPASGCEAPCDCGRGAGLSTVEVCRRLEQRLGSLMAQGTDAEQSGRVEDRMLKICRIIEFLRSGDEIGSRLQAMHEFARFCIGTLSESEMQPVRMAITRYLDKLKEENS